MKNLSNVQELGPRVGDGNKTQYFTTHVRIQCLLPYNKKTCKYNYTDITYMHIYNYLLYI